MTDVENVRLFALTDLESFPDLLAEARPLCNEARPGSVAIVVRDKVETLRRRLEVAQFMRRVTSDTKQLLFIGDRPDLARSVEADGVHLPADGMRPRDCRQIWDGAISRAGHGMDALSDADWAELDGILVSPVCANRKGHDAIGLSEFEARARRITARSPHVGIYALGGVTGENARQCLSAGAIGVATIGSVWRTKARRSLIQALRIER